MTALRLRFHGRSVDGRSGVRPHPHPIITAIRERQSFVAGHMSGELGGPSTYGRLEEPWRSELRDAETAGHVRYVIYSYVTPIAWLRSPVSQRYSRLAVWVVPEVSYSKTTTRHMGYVRQAVT